MSRQIRAGNEDAANANQNRAIEASLVLGLPAAAALALLAEPIVGTLFQRGAFDARATQATAAALAAFAAGLPAAVLARALSPGFFARRDTRTPVKIAALCMVVYVALGVALMGPAEHVGIALATSASAWLNALLLAWVLARRGHLRPDDRLRRRAPRLLLTVAVMGAALLGAEALFAPWLDARGGRAVAALALLIACGLVVFALMARATGVASWADLRSLRRSRPLDPGAGQGP
jgi:putative peptidoglycan lipid II flippase